MHLILGEKYLVDTNILIYGLNKTSLFHAQAREILESPEIRANIFVAQQNLMELVSVLTKTYSVSLKEATNTAHLLTEHFEVITPMPSTWNTFVRLTESYNHPCSPFDIFLVATMLDNEIERIITANEKDFQHLGLREIIAL